MEKKKKISTIFKKEVENDEIELYSIIDTPFNVLLDKKTKVYKIIVGNNIISKKEFKIIDSAYCYIMDKPWELITNIIILTIDKFNQLNKK